ncbi:MAG: pyridoxamine 5'-phosphate oxidase family protein [Rhodobacteraceae bacterium]|nr:pyridoxamine 5'-phosphate oxidase family protein [Paracoccaceae bacterium]
MAKFFECLETDHQNFISERHLFFTASAAADGRVNMSPKGMESLYIAGPNRIMWLNLTGSGNETAGHILQNPRVTLMWCSFTKRPLILRVYGTAKAINPDDTEWDAAAAHFPPYRGARQIFDMQVDMVQTSCGWAVPFMDFDRNRDTMQKYIDGKTDQEFRDNWIEKNAVTIDGKPTGVLGT